MLIAPSSQSVQLRRRLSVACTLQRVDVVDGHNAIRGKNFGVLLPWWDVLFGTSNFEHRFDPTGIRDQVEPGPRGLRNYGRGFWAQQWLGLKRLAGRA